MPTAPSKLFRISDHTFYSSEEIHQIKRLQAAYKAQSISIREFMRHEFFLPAESSGGLPNEFIERERADDEKIHSENERKNQEIAKQKEIFMNNQMKSFEEQILDEKLRKEDFLLRRAMEVDEYIKAEKSDPLSVVTPDNIDIAIDRAMENPIDLEFCIDRRGRRMGSKSQTQQKNKTI